MTSRFLTECCLWLTGKYNDLATAFLAYPDDTIRHIFSLGNLSEKAEVCNKDNCYFTLRSLIILCPAYLVFMSLTAGIAIPGGLFMPSMLVTSFPPAQGPLSPPSTPFPTSPLTTPQLAYYVQATDLAFMRQFPSRNLLA